MAIHQILEKANVESALSDTSEMPLQNKVIKTELDKKVNNTYETTESGKVLGINGLGKVVPTVAGGSLPTATEDGTSLVYREGDWNIQTGYGYITPETEHFNQSGYSAGAYSTVGFVEIDISRLPAKIPTLYIYVNDEPKGEYARTENDGKYYYGNFEKSTWTPVLTEESPIAFKYENSKWYIASFTALNSVTLLLKSPEIKVKFNSDLIPAAYNSDMEFGDLYQHDADGKAKGITIDELASENLITTAKEIVAAINENKTAIEGFAGGVHIEVVDELPTTMTDNTIYYVKRAGSEPPVYDIKLHTTGSTLVDLGSTQIDLTAYVKKEDIVDSCVSPLSNVPLSAKQGMVLSTTKQDKYIGKEKAFNQVVVDENGYITAADTIYSVKIYKNKAETSGEGVVEVSCTDDSVELDTQEKRLAVIQRFCRHCLVTKGMKKITYVDETNFEKDVDGNTVALDGSMGDFMLEIDTLYWKCYNKTDYYEWKFSNYTFDKGCMTAHFYGKRYRKHRYIAVFNPTSLGGTTYDSVSTDTTRYAASLTTCYNRARAGGTSMGANNTYGLFVLQDISLLVILNMFLYMNKDIQSIAKGTSSTVVPINESFTATGGWTQGSTEDYTHNAMTMGIMNLYGCNGTMVANCMGQGWMGVGYNKDSADFYDSTTMSGSRASWTDAEVSMPNVGSTWSYVKDIYGERSAMPFACKTVGASGSTYFCDAIASATLDRVVRYGIGNDDMAGLFSISVYNSPSAITNSYNRLTMCSVD